LELGKILPRKLNDQYFASMNRTKRIRFFRKKFKLGEFFETVLLPVMGFAVPFHLNTIKNVTKSEEGEMVYLRFNFNTPGGATKKDETLPYDDPSATFVRSLSYKSADTARYNELFRQITEMKKISAKKEAERRQKADLVEQDKLLDNKRPIVILSDVNIRPALEGKKLPGDVQIHANGLRYQPIRGDQKVDILFSNVKHLFFQPCDNELYVILHCHLRNPIMVGKKKTKVCLNNSYSFLIILGYSIRERRFRRQF